MWLLIGNWLWANKKILLQVLLIIVVLFIGWWAFIHNPKVIDGLEADKVELNRQIEVKDNQIKLEENIRKDKGKVNEAVQSQISTLRSVARPRRTVIIRGGRVLPSLPKTDVKP